MHHEEVTVLNLLEDDEKYFFWLISTTLDDGLVIAIIDVLPPHEENITAQNFLSCIEKSWNSITCILNITSS